MANKTYLLESNECTSCVGNVRKALDNTEGVKQAEVFYNSSKLWVEFDGIILKADELRSRIEKLGFNILAEA